MSNETRALADELEAKLKVCEAEGVAFKAGWNLIRATIDALRQPATETIRADDGWQPIETAPDREDGILVCDASKPHPAVGVARFLSGRWRGFDHGMGVECIYPTPTHWQPLPEPPSEGRRTMSGLVERLRRTSLRFVSRKGFKGSEEYHINPDGPEAAEALACLQAENARLEALLGEAKGFVATLAMYDGSAPLEGRFVSIPAHTARRARTFLATLGGSDA